MTDVQVHHGDALDVLAGMDAASVDAVVTDPPYGLEFMGREWDDFTRERATYVDPDNRGQTSSPMVAPRYGSAPHHYQQWCERWAAECLRLLKPGGHLLAFGGTRTFHRLTCAVEDAGFEIRDTISWLYASGFPKSLDVSKAIDRAAGAEREVVGPSAHHSPGRTVEWGNGITYGTQDAQGKWITAPATEDARRWQGWGTALKPGWEPIVVARKPLTGTVAGNVLAHGTGALNIGATRIGLNGEGNPTGTGRSTRATSTVTPYNTADGPNVTPDAGRWPANVALDEAAAAELDHKSGDVKAGGHKDNRGRLHWAGVGDTRTSTRDDSFDSYGDTGGASRFYFTAKARPDERPRVDGVAHPTVKPLDLIRWLVRLVTPPGGLVLDPFAGSGTTGEACLIEGFRCVLVENYEPYLPLIEQRLTKPIQPVIGEAIA